MQKVAINKKRNSRGKLSEEKECVRSPNQELPIVGNLKLTIQIGCEPKYYTSPLASFWVRTEKYTICSL